MDTTLLDHSRQRLLAQRQQIVKRLFEVEADLSTLTAEHEIERTDQVQLDVPEEVLAKLDDQSRREVDSNSRSKVCVKYAGPMELWHDALVTTCEGQSRRRLSPLRLSANTEMLRTACFLCVIGHRELLRSGRDRRRLGTYRCRDVWTLYHLRAPHPWGRLEVMPTAQRCMPCQARVERQGKG